MSRREVGTSFQNKYEELIKINMVHIKIIGVI